MMTSSLLSNCEHLVLDSSVIMNLNATGYADRILSSLPMGIYIPKPVIKELERGEASGYTDAFDFRTLEKQGVIAEIPMNPLSQSEFINLVSGTTTSSLGDGEAATIACAYSDSLWAAIDEKKARRICSERYPDIGLICTVDILAHKSVISNLSNAEHSDAILAALEVANMSVLPEHLGWVVEQVDPMRLANCKSLPKFARDKTQAIRA